MGGPALEVKECGCARGGEDLRAGNLEGLAVRFRGAGPRAGRALTSLAPRPAPPRLAALEPESKIRRRCHCLPGLGTLRAQPWLRAPRVRGRGGGGRAAPIPAPARG